VPNFACQLQRAPDAPSWHYLYFEVSASPEIPGVLAFALCFICIANPDSFGLFSKGQLTPKNTFSHSIPTSSIYIENVSWRQLHQVPRFPHKQKRQDVTTQIAANMGPSHSFLFFFSISHFFTFTISAHAASQPATEPNAAHLALGPRADAIPTLTFFTPSPGADPIPITSQSQPVTSYVPIVGHPFQHILSPFERSKRLETGLASITQ